MPAKEGNPKQTGEAARKRQTVEPVSQGPILLQEQIPPLTIDMQRAVLDPGRARPADILALQRLAGNHAVSRLIQAKLAVGPPGDRYEQEADRVAEQVLSMPDRMPAPGARSSTVHRLGGGTPQRQEEEEEIQTKPLLRRQEDEEEIQTKPLVQRQEDEEQIQTKPLVQRRSDGGFEAGAEMEGRLAAHEGGGSPLPDEVRTFMEPRFGADFGRVRVHAGSDAADLSRSLSAQAFTHGQDIYLGGGQYDPGTTAGKRLLAHELTHVVQQTGSSKLQRQVGPKLVQIQGGLSDSQIRLKVVPMYLDFVRMKRNEVQWGKILLPKFMQSKKKQAHEGGRYGHWWTEIGKLKGDQWDPRESYGWWPSVGVGFKSTFKGVPGALNAGEGDQDPDHGDPGELEFHPVMQVDDTKTYDEIRDDVVTRIRAFAHGYKGKWMWRFGWGKNCHTFQEKLMKTVGLKQQSVPNWLKKPPKPPKVRKVGRPFQIAVNCEVFKMKSMSRSGYTLDGGDPIEVLDPNYTAGDASGDLVHIRFKPILGEKEVEGRVADWNIEESGVKGEHEDPKEWVPGPRFVIMAADKTFKVASGKPTSPLTEDLAIKANTRVKVVVLNDLTTMARCRIDHSGRTLYARLRDLLGEPPGAKTGDTI